MQNLNTRDHLLQVGLRHIHATGYASTGLKEILDDAHVPKGSFYHHFSSKEAFGSEVLKLYARQEGERIEKILHNKEIAPLERLRQHFEDFILRFGPEAPISGCLLGKLGLEMADQSDVIQSELQLSFSNWQAALFAVLEEAMDRGDLARSQRPEELAAFLLNSYEGALLRSKTDRSNQPLDNFLYFVFEVLLKS